MLAEVGVCARRCGVLTTVIAAVACGILSHAWFFPGTFTQQQHTAVPGGSAGAPSTIGQRRARAANRCLRMQTSPGYSDPILIVNQTMRGVYSFQGKAGSSTIRAGMRQFQQSDPKSAMTLKSTWFTFVRDPLERSISAFFEEGWQCTSKNIDPNSMPHVADFSDGVHTYKSGIPAHKQDQRRKQVLFTILSEFKEMISFMEQGKCWPIHLTSQLRRLPSSQFGQEVDFVGNLAYIYQDWLELGMLQQNLYGVGWPSLKKKKRSRGLGEVLKLNASGLPGSLAQRICNLFVDDYCCFLLPVPPPCKIECEVELQRMERQPCKGDKPKGMSIWRGSPVPCG